MKKTGLMGVCSLRPNVQYTKPPLKNKKPTAQLVFKCYYYIMSNLSKVLIEMMRPRLCFLQNSIHYQYIQCKAFI